MFSGRPKKKVVILALALATILWYNAEVTGGLIKARKLSLNLGDGKCEWVAAIQHNDVGFPTEANLTKTIIAGYPSGDKRQTFIQLEALTGLSARDEWDFKFLGMTNQPFIKANYPHHEGIWGWGDVGDQVLLVVSDLRKSLVEYHDILWDIGYAQTFEEAYERIANLYKEEEAGEEHTNPPVEDFLVWRDLRVFDEIHWYSWFIDYYMEGGLMRDMFNHELTVEGQWKMSIMPNFFTKHEMRHGRFVDENEIVQPSYDPMCATLSKGCYPVLIIDPEKLVDPQYGPVEARKMAELVNGTEGFEERMIEEEAWGCIWEELVINKKGIKTFRDRVSLDYDSYTYSFELKNEMWHQINRLIEKYEVKDDQVAIDLVNILKGHRDALGVDAPADPISYEKLMSYHLAFPPFFPNQKPFRSDDDFFVNTHAKYENPDAANIDLIIDRRRAWFEEEMEKKRERKIQVAYYDATGWTSLPAEGLSSLAPYATGTTTKINYVFSQGEFARSGREDNVAALFSSYLYIDPVVKWICLTSDDGSKLFLDGVLKVNNDGRHRSRKRCSTVSEGVYKIDVEYFENAGGAELILEFGSSKSDLRVVPPRSWATSDGQRRYRELMRLNDLLEEDLRTLKETDFMGPTTRAEFNRRKKSAAGPSVNSRDRRLFKKAFKDSSFLDGIRQQPKSEQLRLMRSMFG
mmetsp:Transcript_11454/g.16684  ORF Transcript_11454/g.16684 Transcript_11454/m.16684 type:complete len:689 (-) Transcript_11454:183-2249(-)|eukprot:CAMPEP_0197261024 /NCGR_PEP_ID=MMETSP1429-20130617/84325_1 /TAXON_ID=49237 /ORGANISM="Chaetoceros  sp., Strain UNC1202" /LENGTH=688 /DNA_ID=CAMNT_0042725279 /DNA_START=33 /DNA_END=2099 /DNA_ORIENTATION=+